MQYIWLNFTYFDIGCTSGTILKIIFSLDNQQQYCNLNRTLGVLNSDGPVLTIELQQNQLINSLKEGFSAKYTTMDVFKDDGGLFYERTYMFVLLGYIIGYERFKI